MLSNVYMFTWEEQFLLDKELFRRKENFAVKFGQESIFSFDTESRDLAMIKQSIYGGGLFVSKKLVILNGIPMDATTKMGEERKKPIDIFIDDFLSREGKIPEETLILFISSKPDKRLKLYKFLERNAVVKEFNQYKDSQLKDFIISQLGGIFIPDDVVEYLLIKVWANLYRLRFECEKIKTRCEIKNITKIDQQLIDKLAFWQVETNAFALLESLFTDTKRAVQIIAKIQDDGEDRNAFAGMLYRSLKTSLFLVDIVNAGTTDSKEIAAIMWANPWQISKSLKQIKQLQANHQLMKTFFRQLVGLDYSIKSGKLPDTYFRLGIKKFLLWWTTDMENDGRLDDEREDQWEN